MIWDSSGDDYPHFVTVVVVTVVVTQKAAQTKPHTKEDFE